MSKQEALEELRRLLSETTDQNRRAALALAMFALDLVDTQSLRDLGVRP